MEEHERIMRLYASRLLSNATSASSASQANSTTYADATALRETLKTYGVSFLAVLIIFCFLQKMFPRLFAIRSWSEHIRCDLALIQYGLFNWMWKVYWVDDDEIQDQCGMDTLCFFRMLRFGRKLALMGCFNAIWLFPLYRLGGNESSLATLSIGSRPMASISIVNVPSGSKTFVGTVVAAYVLFLYSIWLVLKEFDWYISYRHRFLQERKARNYAVYVSGIPEEYRSSHKLADYFRRCCAHEDDVLEAHCTLNIPNLENKVAKRNAMRQQLEHAQALEALRGSPVTRIKLSRRGLGIVESVRSLQEELTALEREITTASSRRLREHDRYFSTLHRSGGKSCLANEASDVENPEAANEQTDFEVVGANELTDVAADGAPRCICCGQFDESKINVDDEASVRFSEDQQSFPGNRRQSLSQPQCEDSRSSSHPEDNHKESREELEKPILGSFTSALKEVKPSLLPHHIRHAGKSVINEVKPDKLKHHIKQAGKSGVKNVKMVGRHGARQVKRVGEMGVENVKNIAGLGSNVVETAVGTAVTIVVGHEEGTPREAGFVVFTKIYAVHSALQMIHHPKPHVMEVSEAPEPDEIFWKNVGKTVEARRLGGYLSLSASAMLCFFWSLPVAFISSLTQVSSLEKSIPLLKRWLEAWPTLAPLLAQLAPLLLYLLNNQLLPALLTEFSKWEGLIGSANLEASVFVKMSAFMIIQTFFVSAISGSIAAELSNILNDPAQIVELLANSLPGQSSYFLQIVLVFTFTSLTFTMMRVGPLIQAFLRTKVGPRLTEKERNRKWLFFHPLSDPPEYQRGQNTASYVVMFMVTFVYATIAPITACFLLACFVLVESVYRLEFFRNYPATSDSGGKLWMGFIYIIIACMVFAQLTLVGFLALKKAVAAVPLMVPLIVITILFGIFINDKHMKVANTLPTSTCLELDRQNEVNGLTDFSFVHSMYLQPALQPGGGRDIEACHS